MPIQISGVSLGVLTGGPSSITLADLADVSIVTPLNGQYLRYNSGISEWQNAYINADVYDYLDGALSGTQGVSITFTPGPNTIAVGLGAITPTSVAASGTVAGSNLSGTNTGDQTITLTGDVTGSGTGSFVTTLATVNSNVGSFGSSSAIPVITVNAKGLITAVSTASISAATATSLSGGATGSLPYQSAASTTTFLAAGTTSQVLIGGASAPSWSNTPVLTGTNFTGIPNGALTNSSLTLGSTSMALGSTTTTVTGLTSVTSTTFVGALTGNATSATSATNIASGSANQIPYQTGAGATSFYSAANYGVHTYGATGVPASVAGAAGVLQGSASAIPAFTTTPILTGTNFTGIPNGALTNSSLTVGSTNISLGATSTTLAGLTSVTSTTFVGALTGNASTATSAAALTTARSITATADASWTVNFDGSANVSAALTLATVNGSPQTDTFRRITVNGKGLTTATSAVLSSDITTALGYTPVNKAGDTMTGALILNADPVTALGAATKQYVDNIASGLNAHAACFTSTTATLATSSGGTVTYNNGTGGVGATLTTTGSFATIGAASTTNGDRILVKDEATQANNGVYVRTSVTVLTRATDFDDSPDGEVTAGDFVYIQNGTLVGTQWVVTTTGNIIIGTTGIVFSQLSGAGTVTGGTGITVTSNSVALATGNTLSLFNLATNGLVARTAANTVTARSLAVSGTGLSVSNADGVSGNPTVTSNATNANTVSTIVARDGSGNFSAGTITAALTGNATSATNIASGSVNQIPYQTGAGATSFYSAANYGVQTYGATGVPASVAGAAGVLQGSASAIPAFTTTPILTGTNFTGIPNGALTNSSLTLGSTSMALGSTTTTVTGLSSVTSTTFVGALTGAASLNVLKAGDTMSGDLNITKASGTPKLAVQSAQAAGFAPAQVQLWRYGAGGTATPNAQTLGELRFDGLNTAAAYSNVGMISVISGTNAATGTPGSMIFSTSDGTTAAAATRMTIDASGQVGIGITPAVGRTFTVAKTITGSTTSSGVLSSGTVQSDVTSVAFGYQSQIGTQATAFALNALAQYGAYQGTIGVGSTVSSNYGYYADSTLIGGTNNYGFYGNIAAATGRWNLYMNGTAQNYILGNVGIGSGKTVPATALDVNGTVTATAFSGPLTGSVTGAASLNVLKSGDTMTGVLVNTAGTSIQLSSTAPAIRYTETDQGADLKDWWMGVDGGTFQLQTRTDAFAYVAAPLTLTRAGVFGLVGTQTNHYRFSTDASPYYSVYLKARGTATSPTTVADNDDIGDQQFYGYDGTANRLAASIVVEVEGTPATTTVPGRITFKTTPAGSAQTPIERMRIDSAGNTTITTASNSISTLNIVETGTSGANIKLSGNGGTTPNKFIRAAGGVLQVLNNAYSTVILQVNDDGAVSLVGDITINKASPNFLLNAAAAGQSANFYTRTANSERWVFGKDAVAETGSNAGSNFFIARHSDAGAYLGQMSIRRSDGFITFGGTGNFESDSAAFALYLDGRSADGIAAIQFRNFSNVETGRMFVDSSGNWTFSNTSATARLGIGASGGISIPAPAATTFNAINITGSTTGASYTTISNTTGHLRSGVESSVGGTLFTGSSIYASVIGSTTATSLQLATNSIVRATIDSSGNVGIGGASSGQPLEVIKNQNAGTSIVVRNTDAGASASSILQLTGSTKFVNFTVLPASNYLAIQGFNGIVTKFEDFDTHNWRNNAGTTNLTLSSTGNLVATGDVSAYSDARLKTNVEVIKGALGKVLAVRGVTFNKTSDKENARHTGVIAQELQAVLPEAVTEGENGMLTVAYGNTVGLLIEAIKELNAKVETLSAELAALKG